MEATGVIIHKSPYSVKRSVDLLQKFILQHGGTIYNRIDQQLEVYNAGQVLFPLEFLLFGNPKQGGILMKDNPLLALDLPLKIIVWEDNDHNVWIAYNAASYLENRYSITHRPDSALNLDKMIENVFGTCDC